MKQKIRIAIFSIHLLSLVTLIAISQPSRINAIADINFTKSKQFHAAPRDPNLQNAAPVFGCLDRPPINPLNPSLPVATTSEPITLSRFRQEPQSVSTAQQPAQANPKVSPGLAAKPSAISKSVPTPREVIALADPSNYGDRYLKDLMGRPALQEPIIVLHETVGSTGSVMSYFQTYHANEKEQVSYHTMITPDGTIVYFVPPDKRAFGAADSEFVSASGKEAVQTNPRRPRSVNNFAYHISLETPGDGMNSRKTHSGYTEAQYRSLAWLIAKTGVPNQRITTHKAVDRSNSRMDPRSFDFPTLYKLLGSYPQTQEILIGCPTKSVKI